MPNLQKSASRAWERLKRSNGIDCDITSSDGLWTNIIKIVLARVDSEAIASREVVYVAGRQDILVAVEDYHPTGRDPQEGDKFVYQEGFIKITAEARPPSQSEACFYRWYGGSVFRIHCKVVKREQ